MAAILKFSTYKTEIEDSRELTTNIVRDFIRLKTSERVAWNRLRKMSPIPQWGQPHATEPGFFLDFVKPNHVSRNIWELEAEYTPYKGGQIDPNPLARPPEITFSTSLVDQPTLFDNKGRPTLNTAGEFVTGVIEKIPLIDYTVTKNLASDPSWLQTHLGAVNSDTVRLRSLTWKPNTLLLANVSGGAITTENRTQFAEYQLTILADSRGWTQEVWNRGTVRLARSRGWVQLKNGQWDYREHWKQVPILEGEEGSRAPISEPVPLTLTGQPVSDYTDPGKPVNPALFVTLKFDVQKAKAFSDLPLK